MNQKRRKFDKWRLPTIITTSIFCLSLFATGVAWVWSNDNKTDKAFNIALKNSERVESVKEYCTLNDRKISEARIKANEVNLKLDERFEHLASSIVQMQHKLDRQERLLLQILRNGKD